MSGTTFPGPSDATLVQAFRNGESAALGLLYRRHAGAVAAAAVARGAPRDTVADVVQETFARAIAHVDHLRQPARFRSWVLAIARNIATDQQRRRTEVAPLDDHESLLVADDPSPADLLELAELAELVSSCLAGLSLRDATALTMVTQFGFGIADVAAALGTTAGATKVLLHRARRRLRDAVLRELGASPKSVQKPVL